MMIEKFNNDLSQELRGIIEDSAPILAKEKGRNTVYPRDIVVAFFLEEVPIIHKILEKFRINKDSILDELLGIGVVSKNQKISKKGGLDNSAAFILQGADRIVTNLEHSFINVEHVMYSFLEYNGKSQPTKQIKQIFQKFGMSENEFRRSIINDSEEVQGLMEEIFKKTRMPSPSRISKPPGKNINQRADTSNKMEQLRVSLIRSGYIFNLNEAVSKQEEKFIGRQQEIARCNRILLRKKKKNVIIIGEPGTGKTTLVEGLASSVVNKTAPDKFLNSEIYSVNLGNMIAGTKYRGQFEERMKNVVYFMEHANEGDRKTIMFIDEIHTLCKTGSAEGAVDASSIMKPVLAKGDIQCIGTATMEDYRKTIMKDSALMRRFSTIFLEEPSMEETSSIIKSVKDEYEQFHNITVSDEVIDKIVSLADQYIKNRHFPDKAFDVLDESCSKMASENKGGELGIEIIYDIVSEITGIPISTVCGKERDTLSNLYDNLSVSIIAQSNAIKTVSNSIKRARLGLKDPDKPIGTFLFLGPTGTGKTLLSKNLSEILFGKDRIIRLDMSEYMDKTSINKITGSAPGYVGYEDGSKLAEEVRKRPYSVILLDEIEKAHKDVLNVFLQIFDEGRMTDSMGRLVDFRNTIIIMTSNLATSELSKKTLGFDSDSPSDDPKIAEKFLMDKVGKYFAPEFINRLDETVIFNKIPKDEIGKIFDIEFKKVKGRIEKIGFNQRITDSAKIFLCDKGYSEKYGARPMVRAIQQYLETPFASEMLSGNLIEGNIVCIDHESGNDSLTFTKE